MNIFHFLIIAVIATWLSLLSGEVYAITEGGEGGCTGTVPTCPTGSMAQCNAISGTWGCVQNTPQPSPTQTPPSTPTVTPSTGPAKSGLAPPANKTVYYPSGTNITRPLLTLPGETTGIAKSYDVCPNDPGIVMPTPSATTLKNYSNVGIQRPPDIETNYYSGTSATTIPNVCIITSRVYYTQSDGSIKDGTTQPENVTKNIFATITAVCPLGYEQVGAFNAQPEVKYNPTADTKTPQSMTAYDSLVQQGYTCNNDPSKLFTLYSICQKNGANSYITFTFNVPINQLYEVTAGQTNVGSGSTAIQHTNFPYNGVVKFNRLYLAGDEYIFYTDDEDKCETNPTWLTSVKNCTTTTTATSTSMSCTNPVEFQGKAYYEFYYQSCTLQAGFYTTKNTVPASLICARKVSTYNKMNK